MRYRATLQTRTTLEQAGRIAGLAGELGVSEAEVTRRLIDLGLELGGDVLKRLRRDIHQERLAERDALAKHYADEGEIAPIDLVVED
jgi:hypothetical protein